MSIQRKPKNNTNKITSAEKFIDGAPSSSVSIKTKKIPISIRLNNDLLIAIDKVAKLRGMSRNSFISYWCSRGIEAENKDY